MKSNKVLYGLIGIITIVIVNLIVFYLVKNFSAAIIVNIIGINVSVITLFVCPIILGNNDEHYLKFAKFPIILIYSSFAFLVSLIFIIIKTNNLAFSCVMQLVMLGTFIIAMCVYKIGNNATIASTKQNKDNYNIIKQMTEKLELIMRNTKDRELYKNIEKAYDSVKNANLTKNQSTEQIDNQIMHEILVIEDAVKTNNVEYINTSVNKIRELISNRNIL